MSKLLWFVWLALLQSAFGFAIPNEVALSAPHSTNTICFCAIAYDEQKPAKNVYDVLGLAGFGYDSAAVPIANDKENRTVGTSNLFARFARSEEVAAEGGAKDLTYLYQKVGAEGEHLKFGITKNPATRYTQEELAGGRLKIIGEGSRTDMLQLERNLHETLPIGPEEAQKFYIQKQIEKGLKPPPYNP